MIAYIDVVTMSESYDKYLIGLLTSVLSGYLVYRLTRKVNEKPVIPPVPPAVSGTVSCIGVTV